MPIYEGVCGGGGGCCVKREKNGKRKGFKKVLKNFYVRERDLSSMCEQVGNFHTFCMIILYNMRHKEASDYSFL